MRLSLLDVGTQKEALIRLRDLAQKSLLHPLVRRTAMQIVADCEGRDDSCELEAIFRAVKFGDKSVEPLKKGFKYLADPSWYDYFTAPSRILSECMQGACGGDCFVQGTLVLRDDHSLVPIESLRIGDRIWGEERWSTVLNTWDKGVLPTWRVGLNNGSAMRLTPDHKVWVAKCKHQHQSDVERERCSVRMEEREVSRVTVRELRSGDVLVQPDRIPFGTGKMDASRAYVEGLFLSDGSSSHTQTFEIAGQDGCPKEAQKREVQEICVALGIPTTWQRKYISVKDKAWAQRVRTFGSRAPQKHAPSINLDEGGALNLLRGILADSGKNSRGNGRTFTTTSHQLFVQTRVLLKMAGLTASSRYIVDHGGLGTNPIWRLGIRDASRTDTEMKLLRVKDVLHDGAELPCFDIATDDHKVWLPEADWTTSQCDDHAGLICALAGSIGFRMGLRAWGPPNSDEFVHVYAVAAYPKRPPHTQIVGMDTTVDESYVGWEPPKGRVLTAVLK